MTTAETGPSLVIRPRGRFAAVHFRELWRFRDLLTAFAVRDVKLRYRQTLLGVVWVIAQPLLAAGVFTFVFGRVAHLTSEGVPYVVFSFSGVLAWNVFNNIISRSSSSVVAAAGMVSKVYFPRLLLPLASVIAVGVDFSVALGVQVVLLASYSINPGVHVVALPAFLLLDVLLAAGFGMIAAALSVRFRDVQFVIPVIVQLLFFASPVAFSVAAVPHSVRWFVDVNPLTSVLEGFRWSLLGHGHLTGSYLAYSGATAVLAVALGSLIFSSLEREFADVI